MFVCVCVCVFCGGKRQAASERGMPRGEETERTHESVSVDSFFMYVRGFVSLFFPRFSVLVFHTCGGSSNSSSTRPSVAGAGVCEAKGQKRGDERGGGGEAE